VNTVKGYAAQEELSLLGVTEARARSAPSKRRPSWSTIRRHLQSSRRQAELSTPLVAPLVVTENYPQLNPIRISATSSAARGTENRITVARHRYIQAVQN